MRSQESGIKDQAFPLEHARLPPTALGLPHPLTSLPKTCCAKIFATMLLLHFCRLCLMLTIVSLPTAALLSTNCLDWVPAIIDAAPLYAWMPGNCLCQHLGLVDVYKICQWRSLEWGVELFHGYFDSEFFLSTCNMTCQFGLESRQPDKALAVFQSLCCKGIRLWVTPAGCQGRAHLVGKSHIPPLRPAILLCAHFPKSLIYVTQGKSPFARSILQDEA